MLSPQEVREISVRSLTSSDRLHRDCLVTERLRQGPLTTKVTRRCTYRIDGRITLPSLADAVQWAKALDPRAPRQVYVTKELDPTCGEEQVTYKVLGYFYVVQEREVICVSYRHVLSMEVEAPQEPLY
jgi:hypothetical protein